MSVFSLYFIYKKEQVKEGIKMDQVFEKAKTFIYRNARPLELARFKYHFENGSKDEVLTALSFYQNEDGGFGHGLEADSLNPNSAPVQVQTAMNILREIDFEEKGHPIIQGILKFLASGKCFDGHFWYTSLKSNNDYPHAPWWHTEKDGPWNGDDYNPTVAIAGFIVYFADKESALYKTGCRIVKEAYEQLISGKRKNDMHTIGCYLQMLEYLKKAKETEIVDLSILEVWLQGAVKESITQNKEKWRGGYICRPSQYFSSRDSVFYQDNKEIADYECDFIRSTQLEDGSYYIPWDWADYPEEWAVSKVWWKSTVIILNLLYLRGIEG